MCRGMCCSLCAASERICMLAGCAQSVGKCAAGCVPLRCLSLRACLESRFYHMACCVSLHARLLCGTARRRRCGAIARQCGVACPCFAGRCCRALGPVFGHRGLAAVGGFMRRGLKHRGGLKHLGQGGLKHRWFFKPAVRCGSLNLPSILQSTREIGLKVSRVVQRTETLFKPTWRKNVFKD